MKDTKLGNEARIIITINLTLLQFYRIYDFVMIEKEKSNHTWNIDIKATLHMCFERDP
jgi:hypothetical protein